MKVTKKLLGLSLLTFALIGCSTPSNSSSSNITNYGGGGGGGGGFGGGGNIPGISDGSGTNNGGTSNNGSGSNSGSNSSSTPSVATFSLAPEPSTKYTTIDPKSSINSQQLTNSEILTAVDGLYHNPVTFQYTSDYEYKYYGQDKTDNHYNYQGTVQGLETGEYWEHYSGNIIDGNKDCYARYSTDLGEYFFYDSNQAQTRYGYTAFEQQCYLGGFFGSFASYSSNPVSFHENVETCLNDGTLAYNSSLKGYVARINNDETEYEGFVEYILKFQNNKLVYYYENQYLRYKAENSSNGISAAKIVKIDITSYTSPTSISWPSYAVDKPLFNNIEVTLVLGENNIELQNDWLAYKFTPSISGTYRFVSSGEVDPKIEIFNPDSTLVGSHDDINFSGEEYHFDLSVSLNAGTEYFVNMRQYASEAKATTVTITKTA